MRNKKLLGQLCIIGSAIIFGFTPVLAAISYQGGNNGINMAFLRALVPLPLLLFLGRKQALPTKAQWKSGLLAGCLSFGCTLLLYSSYEYISPGLATTLHFLYPLYVTVYEAVRDRERPGLPRLAGLALGLLGSVLFVDLSGEGGSTLGYILALGSGLSYALYIVALSKEAAKPMPLFRLTMVVSVAGVFICGAVGGVMGKLTAAMPLNAWVCAIAVALLAAVVGGVLFQRGVREIGGGNSALLSLFEPITSVIFSVWLLNDILSLRKLMGCALILGGLLMVSLQKEKK
ncbi:MAG: DMT family transporter [Clostridia bacterium]|nr:DMT family transporter [Clostridia bacterium]